VLGNAPGTLSLVDESNSKGIADANVSSPEEGLYCFADLGFDPKIAIATFELSNVGSTEDVIVRAMALDDRLGPFDRCPGAEQASVSLVARDDGAPINGRFYVMFE